MSRKKTEKTESKALPYGESAGRVPLALPRDLLDTIDADARAKDAPRSSVLREIIEDHYAKSLGVRSAEVIAFARRKGVDIGSFVARDLNTGELLRVKG
jgi:hypothetical protein